MKSAGRQFEAQLHAGDARPTEPLKAYAEPGIAKPVGARIALVGIAFRDCPMRTQDEGQLCVDRPFGVEGVIDAQRQIVVVSVLLDFAGGWQRTVPWSTTSVPDLSSVCGT